VTRGAGPGARLRPSRLAAPLLRPVLRRALLRALRAPRLAHDPPLVCRPLAGATLTPLRVRGARGQTLAAWLIVPDRRGPGRDEPPRGVPAVLALHGWGANASTMWPLVDPLVRAGFAVMLLDASCHGDSGDEPFSSLPRFAEDLAEAAAVLAAHPAVDARRIGLVGHSVGAAAVMLHAARAGSAPARDGVPPVGAVVSLAAFAHPEEVMRRWMAQRRLPAGRLAEAIVAEVQQVIGTGFDAIAPLRTIALARCDVMIVHGLDDATVPVDDARRLHRVRADAELLLVRGDHDLRDALAPHAPRIVRFLDAALAAPLRTPTDTEPA
jgi:dipeptidyl aminopeptidase/acylaminoacyl peptidase